MNTSTSLGDGIRFLPEEPGAPPRAGAARWRAVRYVIVMGIGSLAAMLLAVGIASAVRESRRQQCDSNLRRLGTAFHEYHEAHGHFPAPALASRDGTPLLSWRVALLPHPGYQSLYERFHLDEPWDSPHNRSLLVAMPHELSLPSTVARLSAAGDSASQRRACPGSNSQGSDWIMIDEQSYCCQIKRN
jgi:hypothetical protein